MPQLACWSCGRRLYATTAMELLFADERRCPRCGALLNLDRRQQVRRQDVRRQNLPGDPGPPADAGERRVEDRRQVQRRREP
ncbi:MAG: hypothetical protein MUC54_05935 [Chloroflexi bacterium]|jgi:hypothetical protein|nr:hypothetical protein [Chloroflexota bacterium]